MLQKAVCPAALDCPVKPRQISVWPAAIQMFVFTEKLDTFGCFQDDLQGCGVSAAFNAKLHSADIDLDGTAVSDGRRSVVALKCALASTARPLAFRARAPSR